MANLSVTLNGTTLYPTEIDDSPTIIGGEFEAQDGTSSLIYRNVKRRFVLRWENPLEATNTTVNTLAVVSTTMTYVHATGTSYTVRNVLGGCVSGLRYIRPSGYVHTAELTVQEV